MLYEVITDPQWVVSHAHEVQLLDVRQPEERSEGLGSIAGAKCIPLGELRDRLAELTTDRPLIPVCRSGTRSAQASVILRQAGFTKVANLRGGMLLWRQLGLPLVPDTGPVT